MILWVPASAFVDVFRAISLLVLLIWLYYGLAIILNIDFTPFQAGILGLGLLYGAFLAEVFRSGLQRIAQTVVVTTFRPFEVYTFVAAVYLVIVIVFSRLVGVMERRLR